MGVFVSEFAAQRGMSVQGVYKAIKRHNIPTLKGVSNGKSAQFMTDEDAARLNELLGPTATQTLVLQQSMKYDMTVAQTAFEEKLKKEFAEKEAKLGQKLEEAKNITRPCQRRCFRNEKNAGRRAQTHHQEAGKRK